MRTIHKDIVGAFIFSADNKMLLGKSLRGTYEGFWLIPGGGIEDGETQEQALIREIFEETALDISNLPLEKVDLELSGESTKKLKDSGELVLGKYKFFNFVVRLQKDAQDLSVVAGDDFAEATWHDVATLHTLLLPPPSIATLQHLGLLRKEKLLSGVSIEKLVHGGQALGTLEDGQKIFVWNALPGEVVNVMVTKSKKSYMEGFATEILKPSEHRVTTLNARDIELSVAPWSIMNFAYELEQKAEILYETFMREGIEIKRPDIETAGKLSDYRNKVEFSFWGDDEGLHYAHYLRASHQKIKLEYPFSSLIPDQVAAHADALLRELNSKNIRASDLKSVILRCDAKRPTESKVVMALFVKTRDFPELETNNLAVVYSNPKSPASVKTEILYMNDDVILTDTLMGTSISYDVFSFFQVNLPVFEVALKRIKYFSGDRPKIDMYSGVGSIGIPIGMTDVLVDIDESNIEMARKNVGRLPIEAVCAPSEKALDYIDDKHNIIVDPPRAGLHAGLIQKLLEILPPQIIYLSCNPSTQARDIALLSEKYKIRAAEGYNFFPRTPHIESLVVLEKQV